MLKLKHGVANKIIDQILSAAPKFWAPRYNTLNSCLIELLLLTDLIFGVFSFIHLSRPIFRFEFASTHSWHAIAIYQKT